MLETESLTIRTTLIFSRISRASESNKTPEQLARDNIDDMLSDSAWIVQDKKSIDFNVGPGVAIREYQTDTGPADYALFVDREAVGIIEAKPEVRCIPQIEDYKNDMT